MRIAWFSPLPPMASGIADYSFELLPLIAERAEVDAFCPTGRPRRRLSAPSGIAVIDPGRFASRADRYDAVFYHLGNNPFHAFVYRTALERSGVTVFHELVLHHLIDHMLLQPRGKEKWAAYEAVLRREYGDEGSRMARLSATRVSSELERFLFPLSAHVLKASRGAVVHNARARDQALEAAPAVPVWVIPHHAGRPPEAVAEVSRGEARARLGLPQEAFLVGQFGFVTRPKQPVAVVEGFARLVARRPDALLLVVGENQVGMGFEHIVRLRNLQEHVRPTGYVDLERFHLYLKAVDAVVNLRYPSAGEASGTFTRALAEGRASIVSNLDSFTEVPDDACLKVEVDGDQAEDVGRGLIRLAEDPVFRSGIERRAKEYARTALDPRKCADLYLDVARNTAAPTPAATA